MLTNSVISYVNESCHFMCKQIILFHVLINYVVLYVNKLCCFMCKQIMLFHNKSQNVAYKTKQKIDLFSHCETYCFFFFSSIPSPNNCHKIRLLSSHVVSGIIFIFLLPSYWWV